MGVELITFRDAPVDIKPLKDRIAALENESSDLKTKVDILETEVEKLKLTTTLPE